MSRGKHLESDRPNSEVTQKGLTVGQERALYLLRTEPNDEGIYPGEPTVLPINHRDRKAFRTTVANRRSQFMLDK